MWTFVAHGESPVAARERVQQESLADARRALEAALPHLLSHEREETRLAHLDAVVNVETVGTLQAKLDRIAALAEEWRYKGEYGWGAWQEGHGPDPEGYVLDYVAGQLRVAIRDE